MFVFVFFLMWINTEYISLYLMFIRKDLVNAYRGIGRKENRNMDLDFMTITLIKW